MLTTSQQQFYQENGYLHLPGVFSPAEADALRAEAHALIARLAERRNIDATWGSAREVAMTQTQLLHCHDVQMQSAAFARMIVDMRFAEAASGILGSNVQLHHTKLFIKPPEKGSPFPMHQDAPFFPHENHSMIAAVVHFDDAPLERGCLRVVPGSHKRGMLPHIAEGSWHLPPNEYPIENSVALPAKAGDIVLFSYLTIHGSGLNVSDKARTTVLVQMRDPEDVPSMAVHLSPGQGMMLHGFDPTCGIHPPLERVQNADGTLPDAAPTKALAFAGR